ncbi:MAG: serine/threonine-protein phosphatase [Propionibacteriaceae bacterium]|jgi:serine/threonine protein phosphatase PrpC|nr:serine/threonine-protein phosphatase [Propionibacteriaceae bacterium]
MNDGPGVLWQPDEVPPETEPVLSRPPTVVSALPSVCPACGGEVGIDGYCTQCGTKVKSQRDHDEQAPASWVGGVCDIGVVHARNEDALAIAATDQPRRAVIVVCDGVTTSDCSDVASLAAVRATTAFLWQSEPQGMGTPESKAAAMRSTVTTAIATANEAVVGATGPESVTGAAATLALAVVTPESIVHANIGDSRVYWLPDEGEAVQWSTDHSMAQMEMDAGISRAEAEASPYAHTITKWLGRDATDLEPALGEHRIDAAGWLLVCSDGLWNYASDPADLAEVFTEAAEGKNGSPLAIATALVDWATDQGGHDNITAACARIEPPEGAVPASPAVVAGAAADDEPTPLDAEDVTMPMMPPAGVTSPLDPTDG